MKTFKLRNNGIIDTEIIAEGVEFSDGQCVVKHAGLISSVAIYKSIADVEDTTRGALVIQWDGETALGRIEATQREILARLPETTPTPAPPPPPPIPVPMPVPTPVPTPSFEVNPKTVALWDWTFATIANVPPGGAIPADTPAIGPVSSNDTNAAGDGSYTRIVDHAGVNVVEFAANHDIVQRPEGTAARLLMRDWGFWMRHAGMRLTVEYGIYLPDAITVKAGGSLGMGLQTKHDKGVIWALDAETLDGGLSPWIWNPTGKGVVKPLARYVYPIRTWVPVRIESLLHATNGSVDIHIDNKHLFHFEGRTLPGGIGLQLYNVNAVTGWVKALFSDVRFDISEAV